MAKAKAKVSAMDKQKTGNMVLIKLPKPYHLNAPDLYETIDGEPRVDQGEALYLRTGTVISFDAGYWLMHSSFITENLNEPIEVYYDIPGKKVHSIHTKGMFPATVHCISNLAYHANVYSTVWKD
jgi:hypothetical protein